MGKGKGAGEDAAALQAQANLQGINEIKRQFDLTKGDIDPFIQAGQEALPGVQAGSTFEGFGDAITQILSGEGPLKGLIDDRTTAAQSQLAAGGLTRSGTAIRDIANIPAQLGLDIENLLFGRKSNLASGGASSALSLGSLGQGAAANQANLFSQTGSARSSGSLLDAESEAAGVEQIGSIVATVLPLIFSDPALKTNIEEIGEIDLKEGSLKIYQWDWIPEAKDTIVPLCPTMGFMADEVQEAHPEFVTEYGGFRVINYLGLLSKLEAINELELEAA